MREEVWVKSPGILDIAVGVRLRGRVRLGGHHPSEGWEGGVDMGLDVDEFILVFFAHV